MTRCPADPFATLLASPAPVRRKTEAAPTPAVRSWRDLDGRPGPHRSRPGVLASLLSALLGRGG